MQKKSESTLYALFGLLVGAHYRTGPGDLMRFLDDEKNELWTVEEDGALIGALVGSWEGGLHRTLAEEMAAGLRRPHGHFMPGVLSAHLGLVEGAQAVSYRIQRIAIHPQRQRLGLGPAIGPEDERTRSLGWSRPPGYLLGATGPLLSFWGFCSAKLMRLGVQRGRSTGEFSALMGVGLTSLGIGIQTRAQDRFLSTADHLWRIGQIGECLVHRLAECLKRHGHLPELTADDRDIIEAFLPREGDFDRALPALSRLMWRHLANTSSSGPSVF